NRCKWVGWCEPIADDVDGKNRVETDPYADARMGNLEDEFNNLKKLVEGLTEAIQEEVATVKFEFDNDVSAKKKDVDDKLLVLKNDFDKDLITLKTELLVLKKTNGKMRLVAYRFNKGSEGLTARYSDGSCH
ncbi:hypothetical protein A2U01_0023084, partial [Trifolium medium]|nr:hypothetical protein [Trifolium medium]